MGNRIGVFDSGIGGFSILKEIFSLMPSLDIYYIADDVFAPYGEKSSLEINERCSFLTEQLLEKEIELIVLACNTATAVGIDHLREKFDLPFVGVEPYLNAQNHLPMGSAKPVVLTTELMGNSKRYQGLKKRFDPEGKMTHYSFPQLASLIEKAYIEGVSKELLESLHQELGPLKERNFTHAILGCTHYPLIAKEIAEFLKVETISPCLPVAKRVQSLLNHSKENLKLEQFWFMSTKDNEWRQRQRNDLSLTWPVFK